MPDQTARLRAALAGRYDIERELGSGGMATVYLARDVRHDRLVAVKVLRAELAANLGPERFLREVRIAAKLTHPHILPVHDSGEADGFLFYVMPFIDGESLRTRIDRDGPLPVTDAARILRDVVDALAAAHARGIVHRDIKPDNVLLAGRHAFVADFGVAKAVSEATGRHDATTVGVALGTPSYMAPEQASGEATIDHRADLYAVGAMAYEMLTGRPPFTGASVQQVISAHLTAASAPVDGQRSNLPTPLSDLVMGCLQKAPADRVQTAAEMVPLFETLASATGSKPAATTTATPTPGRVLTWAIPLVAMFVVAAVAGVVWLQAPDDAVPPLTLGQRSQVTRETTLEVDPAFSPNGQFLAYAANPSGGDMKVYVRQVDGGSPIAVAPDLPGEQRYPAWSPDGGQLTFRSTRGLEIVPATGGVSRRVGSHLAADRAAWSPDGTRLAIVSPAGPSDVQLELRVISRDGDDGNSQALVGNAPIHSPAWSPDGRWIAFVRGNTTSIITVGNIAPSEIWVVRPEGGAASQVTNSGGFNSSPAWLGSTLLFVSDRDGGRDIYTVDFTPQGPAAAPARALTTGLNTLSISVAADVGRLAYSVFVDRSNVWSMPVPSAPPGSSRDATPVTTGNQVVELFGISNDGQWIAFDADRAGNQDIYRQAVTGGPVEQLTTDVGDDFAPEWSKDDSEIVFYSYRNNVPRQLLIMASTGGPQVRVVDGELSGPVWSPDGSTLALRRRPGDDLVLVRRRNGAWQPPVVLAANAVLGSYFDWSPDGRFLTFTSATGLETIAIASGERTVVIEAAKLLLGQGQFYPQWAGDGRSIYYIDLAFEGIHAISPSGGPSRLVVRFDPTRPWHRYGFRAVGDRFFFTLGEVESDLWVADVGR